MLVLSITCCSFIRISPSALAVDAMLASSSSMLLRQTMRAAARLPRANATAGQLSSARALPSCPACASPSSRLPSSSRALSSAAVPPSGNASASASEIDPPLPEEVYTNSRNQRAAAQEAEELPSARYHIERAGPLGDSLPVYLEYKHNRTQTFTVIRKIGGDVRALREDLCHTLPSLHQDIISPRMKMQDNIPYKPKSGRKQKDRFPIRIVNAPPALQKAGDLALHGAKIVLEGNRKREVETWLTERGF